MTEPHYRNEAGFTLVEVLVAFAILAVTLGFLMHVISNVLDRTGEADARAGALQVAQSLIDRIGADLPLEDGGRDGDSGRHYRWHVEIAPYGDADDRSAWPAAAHHVTVTVAWGDHGSLSLSTLKLGPKDDAP
ncbi:type II secretion system protein I [Aliidongia dinghuensis]|uniref:Type II secretion system protein I n=1 Tax=Aliidongia dinghuensis TaxID=1867774 RepID=A0A8J2Z1T9_9PROT|nr:type II secretion system protein [Aliidongia dinghuensis]GGF51447.1 type II secretion system protein I [Aliidongia dinghuensis]